MIAFLRTTSSDPNFQNLVIALDQDLSIRNGEDHSFYVQFNKIDSIKHTIVAYEEETRIGCDAIKEYPANMMELKRMFVVESKRGQGIASTISKGLENRAAELNYEKCILETGKKQPEAIALYQKNNYKIVPNYG